MITSTARTDHCGVAGDWVTSAKRPGQGMVALVAAIVLLAGGHRGVQAAVPAYQPSWNPIFKGISHIAETNLTPARFTLHAMRVDLSDPDVRMFTTPPITNGYVPNSAETSAQTPGDFLTANRLKVAINGSAFNPSGYTTPSGANMMIKGWAISQGIQASPDEAPSASSEDANALMLFTSNKVGSLISYNWPRFTDTNNVYHAVAGLYALVNNGVTVYYTRDSSSIHRRQPRTAIGYSADGRYCYLLVIDGRDVPDDVGAYDDETSEWMIYFGAAFAMNLDGGGSTCMVKADDCGNYQELNSNSFQDAVGRPGAQRPVAHNIGFYAKTLSADFIRDPAPTPGRTMAVLNWETATPATTQVEYGPTAALGFSTPLDAALATNHTVVLTGLTPRTTNYFRLLSLSNGVPFATPVCTFVTLSNPPPVVQPTNNFTQLFPITQSWRYNSNNLDGVAWKTPAYNDAGWMGEGPGLLYIENNLAVQPRGTPLPGNPAFPPGEEPPNSTYPIPITYYFRTTFNFPVNPAGVMLVFSNYLDDGAVWYLNGVEVNRRYMPATPAVITCETYANSYGGTGEAVAPEVFNLSGAVISTNLIQGQNTMAVEVHNYKNPSGGGVGRDLVFGMALYYGTSAQTTNSLVVHCADPGDQAAMTLSTSDNFGARDGIAPFERAYYSSATVQVTASNMVGDKVFKKWRLDGADYSTNQTVSVAMSASHVLVAVYEAPAVIVTYALNVATVNPAAGVSVQVTPPDLNTNGGGTAPLTLVYTNGSVVSLTAPAFAGANYFLKWQTNGVDCSTNRAVSVTVATNLNATAVYATPVRMLMVQSDEPDSGVGIVVTPSDLQTNGNGTTPFSRTYLDGATVNLAAPAIAGTADFVKWQLNGADYSTNLSINLVLAATNTLTAVYSTPVYSVAIGSVAPNSGVAIEVAPLDVGTNGPGATPLLRHYHRGTMLAITAPALVEANSFDRWLADGALLSTNRAISLAVATNLTLTAVFAPPPAPPPLTIHAGTNYVVLNWTNSGFVLQQSTNLGLAGWSNVPGPVTSGPHTNAITAPAQYFRLQQQVR